VKTFEKRNIAGLLGKGQKQLLNFVKRTGKSLKGGRPFEKRAKSNSWTL